MNRSITGVYAGQSAEERRSERRAQLLAAGIDLIGTQGWSATTVRGVCSHAKLTTRFFYESFDDLEDLAVAVFDSILEETAAQVLEALAKAPDSPREKAHAGIDAFVRGLTDDPRRARIAFIESLGNDALLARRQATTAAFAHLVEAQAQASYAPPDSAKTFVALTTRMLVGGLAELLITWLEGGIEMDREDLIEDCVALFFAIAESAAMIARSRNATGGTPEQA